MKNKFYPTTFLLIVISVRICISQTAYITNSTSNTLSVIDVATNTLAATIPVGNAPWGVSVSQLGCKVYIANQNINSVSVINSLTNIVSATIGVGSNPFGVCVSPDGSKVYVSNYNSNTVSVIDTVTNTVTATIPVGHHPEGIIVSPDGSKVYVATIKDTNNLSDNDIADVIIANSPVTQQIKDSLNTITMSSTLRNLIDSAQTGTSARGNSEMPYSNLKYERTITENEILRSEFNNYDSIPFKDDTIISNINEFINKGGGVNKDDMLAYYYADRGDWAKTDSIRNYDNSIYERQNLAKLINVYLTLKQDGKNIYGLVSDTALQQIIQQVVNDSTLQGYAAAIKILQQVFGKVYYEPILDVADDENKSMILANLPNKHTTNAYVMCYPNPATDNINFKYLLPNESNQGLIKIYNDIGQLIKSISINTNEGMEIVSINNLSNGLYYYTLIVNSTSIARDKFIINK